MTKLDVLDSLKEIQIATSYQLDGKPLPGFPGTSPAYISVTPIGILNFVFLADLDVLSRVTVEYITLPGWETSIESITSYDAFPPNCKAYIEFIEKQLRTPIEWIGVGPGREAMVKKEVK